MGRSTALDVLVALARQQASESGHWDREDAADVVVLRDSEDVGHA
jgi:hypothetical protein